METEAAKSQRTNMEAILEYLVWNQLEESRWGIYETLIDGRSHRKEHWPQLDRRRNITGMRCWDFRATWLCEDCCLVTQSCSTFWRLHRLTHQAPLPMGFHRQEYWNELPFPPPEYLPNPGIKPTSPVSPILACRFFTIQPPGKPPTWRYKLKIFPNV